MTIHTEKLLESILASLDRISFLSEKDMPNIPLYMDQVTTYLSDHLRSSTRYPDSDKILTKTMINNYAKNRLLPPPENKKYTKEHLIYLLFIYYYKGVMSIGDITTLLSPLTDISKKERGMTLPEIYEEVFSLSDEAVQDLKKQVEKQFHDSEETFFDAPEEDRDFLRYFTFICMLSFDVYVKKLLIEKLVDELSDELKKRDRSKEQKNDRRAKKPGRDRGRPKPRK